MIFGGSDLIQQSLKRDRDLSGERDLKQQRNLLSASIGFEDGEDYVADMQQGNSNLSPTATWN